MPFIFIIAGIAAWESYWWAIRRSRRSEVYRKALRHARMIGRPLVVIGAPDAGITSGYGCGDLTIDLSPSSCPRIVHLDITKPLPFSNNSVCSVTMCTLEYVQNAQAALHEIHRISGPHAFFVGVEPWTLTAYLYPGAKRTMPERYR